MFDYYKHLGFHSKYYITKNNSFKIYKTFSEAIPNIDEKKLDVTAIIEFINNFYFFGDRTIFINLNKTPWLAKPDNDNKKWVFGKIKDKLVSINSEIEFANKFIELIEKEIISYINNSKKIGLLLTGGMDSRIIAAIINKLKKEKRINVDITALTWGLPNSRDVVYAQKISRKYNWEFINLPITANTLKKNIIRTAKEGCEFSPIHLHGILDVVNLKKDFDIILAGSFGDSIGRAEYSGVHAMQLKSIGAGINNKFGLIHPAIYNNYISNVQSDIDKYAMLFKRKLTYSNYEIERMAHYMRKELNPCMSVIDRKTPLFQVFTSPDVYNFVLNVPIKLRNDMLYYNVLKTIDKELLLIPWARTGKLYLEKNSVIDSINQKEYHDYEKWIRNDLYNYIEELIFDGNLEKTGIFNMNTLKKAIKINKIVNTSQINRIDELLTWFASLSILLNKNKPNNITGSQKKIKKIDKINSDIKLLSYILGKKLKV